MRRAMPRYKLTLEYHGAPFVGWQRQENGASVRDVGEMDSAPPKVGPTPVP